MNFYKNKVWLYYLLFFLILLIFLKNKEYFTIDTIKDDTDRLKNRLAIEKELTEKYKKDFDIPFKGNLDLTAGSASRIFFNTEIYQKISNKKIKKSESNYVKPWNYKFKKEQENDEKSKNIKLDEKIIEIVKNTKNKIIYRNLESYKLKKELKIDIKETQEKFRKINYKNIDEIKLVLNSFCDYLTDNSKYSFSLLEIGKTDVFIRNSFETIEKLLVIRFYIYESKISYTKRLNITFLLKTYPNKKGSITVNKVVIPKDADLNYKPLLPALSNPFKINSIGDNQNVFYTIENIMGLNLPYKTNETDMFVNKSKPKPRQSSENKYACYGIPESFEIPDQVQCVNFGGTWDKPVENDSMCPFFNSNKNYTNKRGGKRNGYCEMPSGTKRRGYRHIEATSKPLCYNCKKNLIGQGTLGNCCEKQKFDKLSYPTLRSPDYKFPGDKIDRINSRNQLNQKNLSIN